MRSPVCSLVPLVVLFVVLAETWTSSTSRVRREPRFKSFRRDPCALRRPTSTSLEQGNWTTGQCLKPPISNAQEHEVISVIDSVAWYRSMMLAYFCRSNGRNSCVWCQWQLEHTVHGAKDSRVDTFCVLLLMWATLMMPNLWSMLCCVSCGGHVCCY